MFYLKHPRHEISSVEALISFKGTKYKFQTGESVPTKFWKSANHRAKYRKDFPEGKKINERLDKLETAVTDARDYFKSHNQRPEQSVFREKVRYFLNPHDNSGLLIPYIRNYADTTEMKRETKKKYYTTIYKLEDFEKYTRETLTFDSIDIDFYNKLERWFYTLRNPNSNKPYSANYFGSLIKVIKKIMRHALENGEQSNTKFQHSGFKVVAEPAESVYLNQAELKAMFDLDITEERVKTITADHRPHNIQRKKQALIRSRDRFLLGAYTALRVSDFNRLADVHFTDGFLRITTTKTAQPVYIPVHPVVKKIIDRGGLSYSISEQKLNVHIKEVARLAGITREVTTSRTHAGKRLEETRPKYQLIATHTARRSAATNMFKAGIPAISIMKLTGHTTEQSFMKYIKITQEENAELLRNHAYFKDS